MQALAALNERAREIFRQIVESYLTTGEPVGSRNLARILPMALSPASIRIAWTGAMSADAARRSLTRVMN